MDIKTTAAFDTWLKKLRDQQGRVKILARFDRLLEGNAGNVRALGDGVIEMRIDFGPGYRVYFRHGLELRHALRRRQVHTGTRHRQGQGAGSSNPMTMKRSKVGIKVTPPAAQLKFSSEPPVVNIKPFDTARHLDNPEVIAGYLTEAFQSADEKLILRAVQNVLRAGNMSKIARATGLSRTSLYWRENTSPEFTTVLKVLAARGVRFRAEPDVPGMRAGVLMRGEARGSGAPRRKPEPSLARRNDDRIGQRGWVEKGGGDGKAEAAAVPETTATAGRAAATATGPLINGAAPGAGLRNDGVTGPTWTRTSSSRSQRRSSPSCR
jgi:putative addiction module killer protein/probable addiction module antidote protein